MTGNQRRKLDKFQSESIFMAENKADFPANSQGDKTIVSLNAIIAEINTLAAQQISGFDNKNQSHGIKDDLVEDLQESISQINLAAKAMTDEEKGIDNKFRLPRKPSEQILLATSRSFLADAEPFKSKFIEYGLSEDFLEELQNLITAFEEAAFSVGNAATMHGAATGGLNDAFRRGTELSQKLNSIVKIKYRNNPAKLSAWKIASHLARSPKRSKSETPTT